LTGAIIRIDGTQCGTVPSLALGAEATITCSAKIVGKSVKVETVTNAALSFSDLQVWGYGCTTHLYQRNAAGTDWALWPPTVQEQFKAIDIAVSNFLWAVKSSDSKLYYLLDTTWTLFNSETVLDLGAGAEGSVWIINAVDRTKYQGNTIYRM
jgi:hypothetical protein